MRAYVLRRLLQMIPLLLGISTITFMLLHLAPGDFLNQMAENPAISAETIEQMRQAFGLDRPWYVQYGLYLRNIFLHFDFGESFSRRQPVFQILRESLGNTVILATAAAGVTWGLAIPLGVLAAARQHTWIDRALSLLAFVTQPGPDPIFCPRSRLNCAACSWTWRMLYRSNSTKLTSPQLKRQSPRAFSSVIASIADRHFLRP